MLEEGAANPQPGGGLLAHHHRLALASMMDKNALVSMMATRDAIDAILRDERPPRHPPKLPTTPATSTLAPTTYGEATSEKHTDIWRDAMSREFFGLADADTFAPA